MDIPDIYPNDGDWKWTGTVRLVAQSASKMYNGQPLTRTSDVLVNGLPSQFSIRASAGGSQTDAGESPNPVSSYHIYNEQGEDVTGHFTNIETISGILQVNRAECTVWTGSAVKEYDGTPLTNPEAQLSLRTRQEEKEVPWRNTSYSDGNDLEAQVLYGVCGKTLVHGTNPLTGEECTIELAAGQKLTVYLYEEETKEHSIEFRIQQMTEDDIYASMTPAKEVGGDLYDFFLIDEDHLALVIGDVSEKGVPASLFMMVAMTLIHHVAMRETSTARILQMVNEEICARNPEEMFVTVWLGILEISTGKLTAANAGHEFPAFRKPGGSFELLKDRHGFVLGGMEGVKYREYELTLEP